MSLPLTQLRLRQEPRSLDVYFELRSSHLNLTELCGMLNLTYSYCKKI